MSQSRRNKRKQKRADKKRTVTLFFITINNDPKLYLHPDPDQGETYVWLSKKEGAGVWLRKTGEAMLDYLKTNHNMDAELTPVSKK